MASASSSQTSPAAEGNVSEFSQRKKCTQDGNPDLMKMRDSWRFKMDEITRGRMETLQTDFDELRDMVEQQLKNTEMSKMENTDYVLRRREIPAKKHRVKTSDRIIFSKIILDVCWETVDIIEHIRNTVPQVVNNMDAVIKHFPINKYLHRKLTSASSAVNLGCIKLNALVYKIKDVFTNMYLTLPQMEVLAHRLLLAIHTLIRIILHQEKQCCWIIELYVDRRNDFKIPQLDHDAALTESETTLNIIQSFHELLNIVTFQITSASRDLEEQSQPIYRTIPDGAEETSETHREKSSQRIFDKRIKSNIEEVGSEDLNFLEKFAVDSRDVQINSLYVSKITEILTEEAGRTVIPTPLVRSYVETQQSPTIPEQRSLENCSDWSSYSKTLQNPGGHGSDANCSSSFKMDEICSEQDTSLNNSTAPLLRVSETCDDEILLCDSKERNNINSTSTSKSPRISKLKKTCSFVRKSMSALFKIKRNTPINNS